MKGERESQSAEADILREILSEADGRLTMEEVIEEWDQRLQVAIRGLRFNGELGIDGKVTEKRVNEFYLSGGENDEQ